MPDPPSYPGEYVEEIPRGVRPITGVATSITAFVGRACRGPVDSDEQSPVRIFSYAEYERIFGGLWSDSPMSYAVSHFFLNGGSDALIVRVHSDASPGTAAVGLTAGGTATFTAASPGSWATRLRLRTDTAVDAEVAAADPPNTLFNLRVKDLATGAAETYLNVSITRGHSRFVSDILRHSSKLLRGPDDTLASVPKPNAAPNPPAPDPMDDPTATAVSTGADDGDPVGADQISAPALRAARRGLFALERADLFSILCIPPFAPDDDVDKTTWDAAAAYAKERRAVVLVDPPFIAGGWDDAADVTAANVITSVVTRSENAALYFPAIRVADPLRENQPRACAPCGAVAGVIARTDAARGVWKSPAGLDAALAGVLDLTVNLTDRENGALNPLGVNCLRTFPVAGTVVWGSRTLRGADSLASEWKYLAVRRMALFLEESLYRGTHWVTFEPNDEPLWAQIRLNIGAFMHNLFRQGAFQGQTPRDAYFVKCDSETTTQTDRDMGVVNIAVGFAPLKPAEFVVITLQRTAGERPT